MVSLFMSLRNSLRAIVIQGFLRLKLDKEPRSFDQMKIHGSMHGLLAQIEISKYQGVGAFLK
jgi:uncharacterized membrane protein affecting hemolysin expression